MISTIVTCDVCGVAKKETNRWFIVAASHKPPYLAINPAENRNAIPLLLTQKDVCGERCAVSLLQRWLATGSLEEIAQAKP